MIAGVIAGGRPLTPDAGGIAARRWRILIAESVNGSYVTVAELSVRATIGGANQCAGGTPIASDSYDPSWNELMAFDGSNSTQWAKDTRYVAESWLGYYFAAPVECLQIAITADNGSFAGHAEPKDFSIQYSADGVTWVTSWSVTGSIGWSYGETRVFTKP